MSVLCPTISLKKYILLKGNILVGGSGYNKSLLSLSLATKELIKLDDFPKERLYHGSVFINNNLYLVGGIENKNIDKYDLLSKAFVTVKTMETQRGYFGFCHYNDDSLIIAGGVRISYNYNNQIITTFDVTSFLYDTQSNNIKYLGNLNIPKQGLVLVNCLGAVYALGGSGTNIDLKQVEKLNPITDKWEIIQSKLIIDRLHVQAISHNEYIYVFGGQNWQGIKQDSVEKINILTGEVTIIESKMPIQQSCFTICKIDSDVCFIGENENSSNLQNIEKIMRVFNFGFEKLTEITKLTYKDSETASALKIKG